MGYALMIQDDSLPSNKQDFGANIFGMSELRREMERCEMLSWAESPRFGRLDDFASRDEYEANAERVRRYVPENVTGICGWKLCSNDGWVVTTREIEAALRAYDDFRDSYRRHHEDYYELSNFHDNKKFWSDFILFLRRAAKHGGFVVW